MDFGKSLVEVILFGGLIFALWILYDVGKFMFSAVNMKDVGIVIEDEPDGFYVTMPDGSVRIDD